LAKHLQIVGIVQGVGYRAAFKAQARALKLSGWVRNRVDGSVEAVVSGELGAVAKIIDWAWRGPSSAQVRNVAVSEAGESLLSELVEGRFEQLPTR
jgi:acylphosphatase